MPCPEDYKAALRSLTCRQAPESFGRAENNLTLTEETVCGKGDSRQHESEATCQDFSAVWDGESGTSRGEDKSLGVHVCWTCLFMFHVQAKGALSALSNLICTIPSVSETLILF